MERKEVIAGVAVMSSAILVVMLVILSGPVWIGAIVFAWEWGIEWVNNWPWPDGSPFDMGNGAEQEAPDE